MPRDCSPPRLLFLGGHRPLLVYKVKGAHQHLGGARAASVIGLVAQAPAVVPGARCRWQVGGGVRSA